MPKIHEPEFTGREIPPAVCESTEQVQLTICTKIY